MTTATETETTEQNVALDIVAALDVYDGLMGSGDTTIELVGPGPTKDSLILVLSDKSEYRVAVEFIR